MTALSYEPGTKKVIFDSSGVLASGGLTQNSLGDEAWFVPFKGHSELPEDFTIEVETTGTVAAGAVDVEGSLGQEPSFSGPSVHGDKAASLGPNWVQVQAIATLTGGSLQFVVDKKVRGIRIRVTTTITGTTPRVVISLAA